MSCTLRNVNDTIFGRIFFRSGSDGVVDASFDDSESLVVPFVPMRGDGERFSICWDVDATIPDRIFDEGLYSTVIRLEVIGVQYVTCCEWRMQL